MKKNIFIALFSLISSFAAYSQTLISGTVVDLGTGKVGVFGQSNTTLNNVLFRNINITISIADQGAGNPTAAQVVGVSNIPNMGIEVVNAQGGPNPHIFGGRAYYSYILTDNNATTTTTWIANSKSNPIAEFQFPSASYIPTLRLDDVPNGGPNQQMYWYAEIIGPGDVTNYPMMFYGTASNPAVNTGGLGAASYVGVQTGAVLPVKFLSFTAVKNGNDAKLDWVVGNETDATDYYEIQRSFNGVDFAPLTSVSRVGSNNGVYNKNDAAITALTSNTVYYRVKQVDKDGQFVYSPVRSVSFGKGNTILVYPNPVKDIAKLNMELVANADVNIIMFDAGGKAVFNKKVNGIRGTNNIPLNMTSFAKGKYNLRVTIGNDTKDLQVIKGE